MNQTANIRIAEWTGPYSWPGFETHNKLPSLPPACGVYLQTVEHNGGYVIYLAGHAKNIKSRFRYHEQGRRFGININILDVDQMKLGIRKLLWNGYRNWWKNNATTKHLNERTIALGYPHDWGKDIPHYETRKVVAFGNNWQFVLEASQRQCQELRIFVATFGPEDRLRKRLEAGIMDHLYQAPPPFCEIPDKGMALSRIDPTKGELPIKVENISSALLHALPNYFMI